MDHGSAVCRADRSSGKQRSHASVEAGKGVELVAARADALGIGVLIDKSSRCILPWSFRQAGWLSPESYTLHMQTGWT